MNYWLMKSEPSVFSINDLNNHSHKTGFWDGVRNYQVRNMIRDDINQGDRAFFYHSSCPVPGIVGIIEITSQGYVDKTQFDPKSRYFDATSSLDKPRWYGVDVKLITALSTIISLEHLKKSPELKDMTLLKKGNRLSIMPITKTEWDIILKLNN
jgi:predicted RNA-binding protein with PUA-like domain